MKCYFKCENIYFGRGDIRSFFFQWLTQILTFLLRQQFGVIVDQKIVNQSAHSTSLIRIPSAIEWNRKKLILGLHHGLNYSYFRLPNEWILYGFKSFKKISTQFQNGQYFKKIVDVYLQNNYPIIYRHCALHV